MQDPLGPYNDPSCSGACAPSPSPSPGPSPSPSPSKKKGGLSGGDVVLIIFFCGLVLPYFVFGALYMKYAKGASGVEMVPNREFWAGLPSLIKEGFQYTMNGFKSTGAGYSRI